MEKDRNDKGSKPVFQANDNDAASECALSSNSNGSRDEEMGGSSQQAIQGNSQDPDPQDTFTTAAQLSHQRNVRFADEQEQTTQGGNTQEDEQMTSEPSKEEGQPQIAEGSSAVPSALGSATNPVEVDNQQDVEIQNEEYGQSSQQNDDDQNL